MNAKRFDSFYFILVTDLVKRLVARGEDVRGAVRGFYASKVYALLSDPATGLWHASTDMLLALYEEERRTGDVMIDWCV